MVNWNSSKELRSGLISGISCHGSRMAVWSVFGCVTERIIQTLRGLEMLAVDRLVHLISWAVRQAAGPAEVTDCRQSGTVPLRFVPTESGSSRAAYCCINLLYMICGSHIVAFTFRVILTATRGSYDIGHHKMLAGRMALPLKVTRK
jgi:hypothetical protein